MDDAMQNCEALVLRNSEGDEWEFQGVQKVADGAAHPDSLLVPPHAIGSGDLYRPTRFANLQNKISLLQLAFSGCTYQVP